MSTPMKFRDGDYCMNFPQEREADRATARDVMRRNGCRSIRFSVDERGVLIAHGYIARLDGPGVEEL